MAKLYELIAVETDLGTRAKTTLKQAIQSFGNVKNFLGQQRRYRPLIDGGQLFPPEDQLMPGNILDDLDIIFREFGDWLDVSLQKEVANQNTSGTIKIGDEVVAESLPAPALLNLENKLSELGKVLNAIPVNDPGIEWNWSEELRGWLSAPRITFRTEKRMKNHIKYEATPEHPAQVDVYTEDDRVGEWTTTIQSGMMSIADKRRMIERWERLYAAVKAARVRANDVEIVEVELSTIISDYIRG